MAADFSLIRYQTTFNMAQLTEEKMESFMDDYEKVAIVGRGAFG